MALIQHEQTILPRAHRPKAHHWEAAINARILKAFYDSLLLLVNQYTATHKLNTTALIARVSRFFPNLGKTGDDPGAFEVWHKDFTDALKPSDISNAA